ncbi:TATA box-binding protein-like 1 [Parasteatoda tepidariorum]|uniref:TATA box-binding protein-like 1 n=1 Tax=Parasteatoda tepidariorum TaxID=114398 RepID=UPI00077FC855|nr:TATA box-binding protein-like 1 [Parasteatoda tepidariorum]
MSSYGGENGFYYGNHYLTMCVEPQTLNVDTLNNVAAAKREDSSANAIIGSHYQEKRKNDPCIVTLSTAQTQSNANQDAFVRNEDESDTNKLVVMETEEDNTQPELDIIVNNVVAIFNVRCHLNLRQIALNGANVEYRREKNVVNMKLRKPRVTAKIFSSGKVTCTGATSDEDAKTAARKVARSLQQLGFRVRFTDYRVVNVLCTCYMYFGINLLKFTEKHRQLTCYEPELHPGATYKIKELKATLKLFTTGSITITAPSVENAQKAVEHIFELVYEFRTPKPPTKNSQCHNNLMSLKKKSIFQIGYSSSDQDSDIDLEDSDGSFD